MIAALHEERPIMNPRNLFAHALTLPLWPFVRPTLATSALAAKEAAGATVRRVHALFAATGHWDVQLHFNKGLAGAPADEVTAARDTAMNPAVLTAFALAIIGGGDSPAYKDLLTGSPDLATAREHAAAIAAAGTSCAKLCRTQDPTYRRAISSSATGMPPSGAPIMLACAR
jgi:hypothetical protein